LIPDSSTSSVLKPPRPSFATVLVLAVERVGRQVAGLYRRRQGVDERRIDLRPDRASESVDELIVPRRRLDDRRRPGRRKLEQRVVFRHVDHDADERLRILIAPSRRAGPNDRVVEIVPGVVLGDFEIRVEVGVAAADPAGFVVGICDKGQPCLGLVVGEQHEQQSVGVLGSLVRQRRGFWIRGH
jgi:hypothetical protein